MQTIEVDFEVFKALTLRRADENVTYNDVVRDLLGMRPVEPEGLTSPPAGRDWVTKGVSFPHGTELRAVYKGHLYTGRVDDGALVIGNERYTSPSPGAMAITGNSVNGWDFWEARLPGTRDWIPLSWFRK